MIGVAINSPLMNVSRRRFLCGICSGVFSDSPEVDWDETLVVSDSVRTGGTTDVSDDSIEHVSDNFIENVSVIDISSAGEMHSTANFSQDDIPLNEIALEG